MNLNIKKISTLAGVGVISFLSTFQPLTNAQAALTVPSSYDYSYQWNPTELEWMITGTTGNSFQRYTRTADGIYFNYSTTRTLITGLDIVMTFNRSNTAWFTSAGLYEPDESKIGSNNTVGSISNKMILTFNNQTNKDYYLYIDVSSTNQDFFFTHRYNGNTQNIFNATAYSNTIAFKQFTIPSYYEFIFSFDFTSSQRYFDAWYLKDLGLSTSYTQGYLEGEADGYQDGLNNNPNILLNGFQAMVGILVNFFLLILNLNVFGVSILSVFSILAIFVGFIWFLKIVRG